MTLARIATIRIAATMATRTHSMRRPDGASLMIGEYLCCWNAAGMPKITIATLAATKASSTDNGLTPSIHIIVVVVSPTTLPEPPALEAATIAAR